MLTRLHIQNFALVDTLSIEFSPKLNVLTGETGAGKSILIDALRFVLGERLDNSRANPKKAATSVEASFELKGELLTLSVLEPFLNDQDDLLILRRDYLAGKNRCWVNQRSINLSALKDIGQHLIDIHGQYDHQLLLDGTSHLDIIDRLGKTEKQISDYQNAFTDYRKVLDRFEEMKAIEEGRERELDLLKYQVEEIERGHLKADEEEKLESERIRMANAGKLHGLISSALNHIEEDSSSASSQIGRASRDIQALAKLDPSLEATAQQLEDLQLNFEELSRTLRDYQESLSFEGGDLEELQRRLDLIEVLKRKYGGSLKKVLDFYAVAKEKYDRLLNYENYVQDIERDLKKLEPNLKKLAKALSDKRKKTSAMLKKVIEKELTDLGISKAQFDCHFVEQAFSPRGIDELQFMVSLNEGQEPMELRKIISAGEASRVMLAMKKALMKVDPVPTLIFDEIDSNIGGRLGKVTGQKLKEISALRQVLLITHLPQIASFADRHFKVSKATQKGKTQVSYREIQGKEKIKELSEMMSGKEESKISKVHAEEMLKKVGGKL